MNDMFRALRADEVECRVARVTDKGCQLLLYKDARCDMNILDEALGVENWQDKFYEEKGILFCSIGINTNYADPSLPDRWIWKSDAGTESNMEAEKGNASDARKRAGFCIGIGRELYTAPFIWIKSEDFGRDEKGKPKDRFTVEELVIENGKITGVEIVNASQRKSVYRFVDGKQAKIQNPPTKEEYNASFEANGVKFETQYCCENCGKVFKPATLKGKQLSAKYVYEECKKAGNGRALCKDCRKAGA